MSDTRTLPVSPKQKKALSSAIATLIVEAEGTDQAKVNRLQVDQQVLETIAVLPKKVRSDFLMLLSLLASPIPGLLLQGWPSSFTSLPRHKREALLYKWANSPITPLRMAFTSLKRMTLFIYYGSSIEGVHPQWPKMHYPGPPKTKTRDQKPALHVSFPISKTITCDVLVIGSGAGGGVVAGTLSGAGKQVVVIDKGEYVPLAERSNLEKPMISRLYESRGMQTNQNHSISLFAGSCLGGGTTVNWSVSWKPSERLLSEWAQQHDLPELQSFVFAQCVEDVLRGIHVVDQVPFNAQSQALVMGSEQLDFKAGPLPQNIRGCEKHGYQQCGFCLFGCQYGNKQDTTETFLREAQQAGTKIYAGMQAHRLRLKNNKVSEVEVYGKDENGKDQIFKIKAASYVLAAGAIHTPALLMRSGLKHSQLGRNLYIHPALLVLGRYPKSIDSWHGGMMTAYSDGAADQHESYGCKIEPSPLHPGLLAAVLPWVNARAHQELVMAAKHYAGFAVITRDRFGGKVSIDKEGRPAVNYTLHSYDKKHSLQGMAAASAIHAAAGAEQVLLTHHSGRLIDTKDVRQDPAAYKRKIAALNWGANYAPMFSSHLMGTCRMGGQKHISPVNPEGRFVGVDNLYVADGSLFPSASGINPMVTIQSLARYIAKGMAES